MAWKNHRTTIPPVPRWQVLQSWRGSQCLTQLSMADNDDPRKTMIYKCLRWQDLRILGQKMITGFFWPKQIEMVKKGYMINMYRYEQDICIYIYMYVYTYLYIYGYINDLCFGAWKPKWPWFAHLVGQQLQKKGVIHIPSMYLFIYDISTIIGIISRYWVTNHSQVDSPCITTCSNFPGNQPVAEVESNAWIWDTQPKSMGI